MPRENNNGGGIGSVLGTILKWAFWLWVFGVFSISDITNFLGITKPEPETTEVVQKADSSAKYTGLVEEDGTKTTFRNAEISKNSGIGESSSDAQPAYVGTDQSFDMSIGSREYGGNIAYLADYNSRYAGSSPTHVLAVIPPGYAFKAAVNKYLAKKGLTCSAITLPGGAGGLTYQMEFPFDKEKNLKKLEYLINQSGINKVYIFSGSNSAYYNRIDVASKGKNAVRVQQLQDLRDAELNIMQNSNIMVIVNYLEVDGNTCNVLDAKSNILEVVELPSAPEKKVLAVYSGSEYFKTVESFLRNKVTPGFDSYVLPGGAGEMVYHFEKPFDQDQVLKSIGFFLEEYEYDAVYLFNDQGSPYYNEIFPELSGDDLREKQEEELMEGSDWVKEHYNTEVHAFCSFLNPEKNQLVIQQVYERR